MKIFLRDIPDTGLFLQGEATSELLEDIGEFTPDGPVHYELEVSIVEENLLVRGSLLLNGSMKCGRCLGALPYEVKLPEYTVLFEGVEKDEFVDLTDSMREDILLALPAYSRCQLDAQSRCPVTGELWTTLSEDAKTPPLGDQWAALDQIKIKNE